MTQVSDDIYALLLPFGYSVLEKALLCSKEEGRFSCTSGQLWPMMAASRMVLEWKDFDAVDRGRKARNALAHERVVPASSVTFQSLDAIERELIGWHILKSPVVHNLQLRVG